MNFWLLNIQKVLKLIHITADLTTETMDPEQKENKRPPQNTSITILYSSTEC